MNDLAARTNSAKSAPRRRAADAWDTAAESSFRSIVETSLQGIVVHRDWRILFANRAAAQTLGYADVGELAAVENFLSLFPVAERPRVESYRDSRMKGEPAPERYRTSLLHKDGATILVELLASTLDWQGAPAQQAAFVDITDSVHTQQMLRESEERYALAMEGANEGMWDWHIETDNLYISADVWRYLGMPILDEMVRTDVWVERIHPDDREATRAKLIAHLRGEGEYFQCEHRLRVTDGSYRWFHIHGLALRREDGRAYRLAGSVHDITLRKQEEQELADRLRFEALLTRVSAEFIALPSSEIDAAIERTLGEIGRSLDVDRGWFLQTDRNQRGLIYTHEWCADGIRSEREDEDMDYFPAERLPWYWERLLTGTPVVISSPNDYPPEASKERSFELAHGVQSFVSVPIHVGELTIGQLGFETINRRRSWSETVVNQLKLLVQVITNAVVRQRTDMALKESEERLRTFMDNTPALMTLKSLDDRYLIVNRAFQDFAGLANRNALGSTPSQVMTREHAKAIAEHDLLVLESDNAVTEDRDLIALDGPRYVRRVTKFPVYDADQNLIGIGSYSVDTSAWKQAEEALFDRESLISAISENLPGALFRRVLRADGRLEFPFVSESLHRVLGLDRDSVVNDAQVLVDSMHPEDRVRWMQALKDSATTLAQVGMDVRIDDPRGGTRWMRSLARPQKLDDGAVVWDGLALDVTDEKKAAEALRESEERFRNLVEGSLQGICIVDTDFAPLFVNNAYAAIFGYRNTEDIQLVDSHLHLYASDERERVLAFGEARLRGEAVPLTYEVDGMRKDGGAVHMVNTLRLIAWKGRPAFQITATDITEWKRTEARLQGYQQQLRRLASEISLAEEKERRRIAAALHDGTIQNLALAKIKLGELERGLERESEVPIFDDIRELLEMSIHDARSLIFELSPPVLYELGLGAAAEWLGEQFQARYGVRCKVTADQREGPLHVDIEVVLFQVLRELLVNIIKHANATMVDISLRRIDDRLMLRVSDDGDGFDATTVVAGAGSGFGLFNIRERLQLLGANLEIDSGSQTGTTISVTAPLAAETTTEAP
jgi:PAS domain S-box-containing protein